MVENKYSRRSIRLSNHDYSQFGWYFITVCTKNQVEYFGIIRNGITVLNELGKIVEQCWKDIPNHFPNISVDEYVIMPNHVHGIIIINERPHDSNVRARHCLAPTVRIEHPIDRWQNPGKGTLGTIIGSFKSISSKTIHQRYPHINFHWHRNYFERIIRDDAELENIQAYIRNNPTNWTLDDENPLCQKT